MERIEHIDSKECKGQKTITIHLKGGNEPRLMLSPQVRSSYFEIHLLNVSFVHVKFCLFRLHFNMFGWSLCVCVCVCVCLNVS